MTALRPERESGATYGESFTDSYGGAGDQGTSYGQQPYEGSGALGEWPGGEDYVTQAQGTEEYGADSYGSGGHGYDHGHGGDTYGTEVYGTEGYGAAGHRAEEPAVSEEPYAEPYIPPADDETVALRIPDPPPTGDSISASAASSAASATGTPTGGRAARRKAAKRRHGRHGGSRGSSEAAEAGSESSDAPLSRVEARRQARARKPSPGVLASRAIGEMFITTGVLMLLFVSYQLWWTNVRAHAQADKEASSLQDDWASGKRNPGTFEPGQGFAILHIPKLDVVVPIAEGISNKKVLDRGMVGHYGEGKLKTPMPDAKSGNFGLAGHRNTHGEPFRYINRLAQGDPIVVETQDKYYVYKMASILPVTSPSNVSVLDPVPPGSGFTGPGRYITLTTCTPEFTSKYRLIVWGKMVEERPRSKGKPDALVS
ncbi:class E sortase [Streptomyces viridochromogenes]|uniref:class E sortase n=1 Tax=Streptomyces viridochromogenes TaxID=1938 RepID=UPI00069D9CD3|nr:class E sortase [Streptomyces viridochromogenes]KOG21239.1 membrane protein [Streptomyces viridochromogenes]KOG22926.1 membrane protein [Streptomyces viridochromogenes]